MKTNKYKNNIKLDYLQLIFRSFNVTHGIWLIFLVSKGFTPFEIGIFESIFHISSLSMEIPTGILADLLGRKNSRILGIFSYFIYVILMIFGNNVLLISIAFIFCGTSYALESGSGEALIYDSLLKTNDEEKFMKIQGIREILFQLSSSIALIIGGYIALISYEINFWILLIAFVAALIPILLMTETQPKKEREHRKIRELVNEHFVTSSKIVYSNKILLFLIITGAFMAAPVTSIFFYFQIYLNESLKYSAFIIGLLLAAHSLFGAIGGWLAPKIEAKFKEKLLLYIVPIFLVISFWLIQIDSIVFVPFVLLGLLDSIFYIILSDYINRIIPSEQRATVLSFNSLAFSVVMIIIFPVLGALSEVYGFKFSFLLLAILITLLYLILLYILRKSGVDISEKVAK